MSPSLFNRLWASLTAKNRAQGLKRRLTRKTIKRPKNVSRHLAVDVGTNPKKDTEAEDTPRAGDALPRQRMSLRSTKPHDNGLTSAIQAM